MTDDSGARRFRIRPNRLSVTTAVLSSRLVLFEYVSLRPKPVYPLSLQRDCNDFISRGEILGLKPEKPRRARAIAIGHAQCSGNFSLLTSKLSDSKLVQGMESRSRNVDNWSRQPQQIRGNCSPNSMSTMRLPPMAVFSTTMRG
jgi:hypothetical protein